MVKKRPKRGEFIKRFVFWIIVIAIFFFLGKNLVQNWQEIPFEKIRFNIFLILLSLIPVFVNFLYGAYLWQRILSNLGEKFQFRNSIAITGFTTLGKYLPGKVWFAVGRVYLAKRLGIREEKGFLSVALETSLLLLGSLLIFLVSPLAYEFSAMRTYLVLAIILTVLFVIALHPFLANKILTFSTRIFKRPAIHVDYNYAPMLLLSLFYAGAWIIYGIGFYLLILSFYPVNFMRMIDLAGVFAISWNLGFLALFAPAGLGVREGVLTLLLSFYFPKPMAIIISLLSRIWITVAEVIFALIALKLLAPHLGATKNQDKP